MNATNESSHPDRRPGRRGASRVSLLLLLAAGAVLAGGGYLVATRTKPSAAPPADPAPAPVVLSALTKTILAELTQPVEIAFFAPADAGLLAGGWPGYLDRLTGLLAEYERAGGGKLRINRCDPQSDAAAKRAAGAVGITPFTSGTGAIVYVGLAVTVGARTEAIAPLAPEWEAALEPDITRTIQRLDSRATAPAGPKRNGVVAAAPALVDPALSEELLRLFPDLAQRPYAEMAQELRVLALDEFKTGVAEMQTKMAAAQQELVAAQAKKSEVAVQTALLNFQRVQAEQTEKLKEITAWLQDRLTVLERLKGAPVLPRVTP